MRSRFLVFSILFGFIVPTFVLAQTATDVTCSGCVNTTDIQNSTITNIDISATAGIAPIKILGTAWTALTDGSASGLDADVFDGIESEDFLRSDQSGSVAGTLDVTQLRVDTANMNTSKIILYGSESSGYGIGTESGGGIVYGVDVADANHFHDFRFGGISAFKIFGDGSATLATEATNTSGNAELRIQAQNTGNDRSAILRFMPSGTGGSEASGGNRAILRLDATSTAATPWGFDFQNTAGSSILGITNDGNVGIGTTSPDAKLDVTDGDVIIQGSTGETTLFLANSGAGGKEWRIRSTSDASGHGGGKLVFDIAGVAMTTITETGRVGIGAVTTPEARLQATTEPGLDALILGHSSGTNFGMGPGTGTGDGTKFAIYDRTAGSTRMVIDGDGDVGIGETDPSSTLYVTSINAGVTINNTTGGTSDIATLVFARDGSNKWWLDSRGNNEGLGDDFWISSGGDVPEFMIDRDTNKVGINTRTPDARLSVDGGNEVPLTLGSTSNHNWYVGPNVSGYQFGLSDASTGQLRMYVDSNGDMCLGDCN